MGDEQPLVAAPPTAQVADKVAQPPVQAEPHVPLPEAIADEQRDAFKLLLCGAGESGKTTLTRQMKLRFLPASMDDATRRSYVPTIRGNLIEAIQILIGHCERTGIAFPEELHDQVDRITALNCFATPLTPDLVDDLLALWESDEIRRAFEQRELTILPDNMDYFFGRLDEIQMEDYVPTNDDVLRMRIRSIGIDSVTFHNDGAYIRIYDVGGQRAERGKWGEVEQQADGLIFVASFADFAKPCFEDQTMLRINDALALFEQQLKKDKWAADVPIFFVANKFDAFATRIQQRDGAFTRVFPDFAGDAGDVEQCAQYLTQQFLRRAGPPREDRPIRVLRSTALDAADVARSVAEICSFVRQNYYE